MQLAHEDDPLRLRRVRVRVSVSEDRARLRLESTHLAVQAEADELVPARSTIGRGAPRPYPPPSPKSTARASLMGRRWRPMPSLRRTDRNISSSNIIQLFVCIHSIAVQQLRRIALAYRICSRGCALPHTCVLKFFSTAPAPTPPTAVLLPAPTLASHGCIQLYYCTRRSFSRSRARHLQAQQPHIAARKCVVLHRTTVYASHSRAYLSSSQVGLPQPQL